MAIPSEDETQRRGAAPDGALSLLGITLAFAVVAVAVFAPALRGSFISDDLGYIVTNPYVHGLSVRNVLAILDPWGEPALYTVNWAPVHLLGHAVEWELWGPRTFGYHVVNVLLHALASAVLVVLFVQRGFPWLASGLAGLVFLVHPANVEAVAWIFQLKTILALLFATAALVAFPSRPLLAAALFALGLLSKASASFALPVAAVFAWNARSPDGWRTHARWLGVWALLFALYSFPQFFTFERAGMVAEGLHPDFDVHVRTMVAIGARYLAMAATSHGVAAFHEPARALSWTDPWWLTGLLLGLLLLVRGIWALVRRREEAAWWIWAAAAWAPISQAFPFLYPMADRYLYTILPGLLGGALCVGRDVWVRLEPRLGPPVRRVTVARGLVAVALVVVSIFAVQSHGRAAVWRSDATVTLDTVRHYPDGTAAQIVAATRAARRGDAQGAADAARRALDRGFERFMYFYEVPDFGAVRDDPRFQAVLADMAAAWIEATRDVPSPTQADLRVRGHAHFVRGELEQAAALLEQALRLGGGFDDAVRAELAAVRARLVERDTADGSSR